MAIRKSRKLTQKQKKLMEKVAGMSKHDLNCKGCGKLKKGFDPMVVSFTCEFCVLKLAPWDEPTQPKEKRPRGWHRKKLYKSPSGVTYSYGKEITAAEARKLSKSTGEPSKPKPRRKGKK